MNPQRKTLGILKALYPHRDQVIFAVAIATCLFGNLRPAQAEGSRELVENGGSRPYTEWRTDSTIDFLRRTVLKVYAKKDEIINVGSSAVGVGSGNIFIFPESTDLYQSSITESLAVRNCKVDQATKGKMTTRAQENKGPNPTPDTTPSSYGGYTPCTYQAPNDGIYQVVFYGPLGSSGSGSGADPDKNTTNTITTANTSSTQKAAVSMWDITVRQSLTSTTDLNGRVFTNYVALNMSDYGRPLKSDLYIVTQDGYRYRSQLNGLDPFGFIFFANSQGLLAPDGSTLYHSGRSSGSGNSAMSKPLLGGVTVEPPTHKLFFSDPDPAAITAIGYSTTAIAPSPAQNFIFTGGTGGSGNQTLVGVGGTFSFDAPQAGSYRIIIDTSNDGIFDVSTGDRILEGVAFNGSNTVTWDGKNDAGVNVPELPGNQAYKAQITLKGGEYHFPLLDAEGNKNGFTIEMLNPPGSFSNGASTTTVFYDDRDYTIGTIPISLNCPSSLSANPCDARAGVDSQTNGHRFGKEPSNATDYGDVKAIDTWIYFPSAITKTPLVITSAKTANVRGTKSVKFLTDVDSTGSVTIGDEVQYSITYSNLAPGNTDATDFVITDNLPPQVTFVNAQITNQTAGNNITLKGGYTGSGAVTNSGTLRSGDRITLTITVKVNSDNGGNAISNQATATFKTPENSDGIAITDADSAGGTVDKPIVGGSFLQILDDGKNTGNDPTNKADDEPTLFKPVVTPGRLRLVKRITRINSTDVTEIIDPIATPDTNDNAPGWQANYLRGKIDGGTVQPGDEVEYTIYFLSDGGVAVQNVDICDLVPTNSSFVANTFSVGSGIALAIGSTTPTALLTNLNGDDAGQYIASPTATPVPCNSSNSTVNPNGAIVVRVGATVPTVSVDPANAYGFIRFRAKVK